MSPLIKQIAETHNIPVIQPVDKADLIRLLAPYRHILTGVVVAYGMIVPDEVLTHFSQGLVNVHASLLPRWRGPSPIEAALLSGDEATGISLMKLEASMDSGPVYNQVSRLITPQDTRLTLHHDLAALGAQTLSEHLASILDGQLTPMPQDESRATYCKLVQKSDGVIDWHQPAAMILRQIRAYLGWPGSRATLAGREVVITAAHLTHEAGPAGIVDTTPAGELIVYCKEGALIIDSLIPTGKREMSGADFARGYLR